MHFRSVVIMTALIGIASVQGCKSPDPKEAESALAGGNGTGGAQVGRYGAAGPGAVSRTGGGTGAPGMSGVRQSPAERVIYFEYDSDDVLPEYVSLIDAHAAYLLGGAKREVSLQGHADERGSSEYNIGLGEQRARAVARLLGFQGVRPEQIQIVSYGEEKPADPGHDEAAWQHNRRVELIYTGH